MHSVLPQHQYPTLSLHHRLFNAHLSKGFLTETPMGCCLHGVLAGVPLIWVATLPAQAQQTEGSTELGSEVNHIISVRYC